MPPVLVGRFGLHATDAHGDWPEESRWDRKRQEANSGCERVGSQAQRDHEKTKNTTEKNVRA